MKKKRIWLAGCFLLIVLGASYYFYTNDIVLKNVTVRSPDNSALKAAVSVELDKPAPIYIEYWEKGFSDSRRTPTHPASLHHHLDLLLLKPNTEYEYRIVLDRFFNTRSKILSLTTRESSPWMVHNWIKEDKPHDETALGDGLVLLCYRGYPGYVAMVDGEGLIRWYWQDEKLGVRMATLTPRNTILALLAPASEDEFNTDGVVSAGVNSYYLRSGKIGFVGGTEIAEIDLKGQVLRRISLEEQDLIIHHDLRMDKQNRILGIYRDYILYDLDQNAVQDTLWGDGIVVMDTMGKVLEKWSAWDHWDIENDARLREFSQDRFHFNTLTFDADSNYLLSTPIENQIWKVNARNGHIDWKLGKHGDFEMDSTDYFYFQHASHINAEGDLMLFDNGDFSPNDTTRLHKTSRALSFSMDTVNMKATVQIKSVLPPAYYTSRMGSAYLLPNGNVLSASSKTGGVLVSDRRGNVRWVLQSYFIPYRAEYVPVETWKHFIQ